MHEAKYRGPPTLNPLRLTAPSGRHILFDQFKMSENAENVENYRSKCTKGICFSPPT